MWKTVKLGDSLSIARGGSPRPIKSFITKEDDGINWIKIGDTTQGGRYIESTKEKIKPSGVSRSRYVKSGDFLLSNSMSFGRPYILKTDGCIHDGWLVLSDYEEIFAANYLYYLLSAAVVQSQFEKLARGSTVRNLNIELVSNVVVSVPPLAEQQRIVAKLDAAFAEIDRAILASSDSTNQLRSLSSNSAKEIFITLRNSGKVSPINDVCEAIFAGGDAPKDSLSDVREGKYQIPIFANAMKDKGLYGYTENPRVKKTSVTVAGRGSGTGYTEIRREPFLPIVRLIVLTPNDDEVTVEFLKHAIVNLEVLSSGSAIPQLTVPMMKSYEIPVPPLDHQRVLTEKLDTLQRIADECMGVYEKKVESLKTLKSAILAQELQSPKSEAA